jgi:dihydroorotase
MVSRDIELARYTGSKIHFTGISTAASIDIIRRAKEEGLSVSCSVTPYHLWFCDEDLKTYDTNLKVNPPLRTPSDRRLLQEAVLDGTVDCISSHHLPYNVDEKLIEFEYARPGMIGLQTAFAVVNTILPSLTNEKVVALFSTNARRLFHLPQPVIAEGAPAQLTLFSRLAKHSFSEKEIVSRSRNTPFAGQAFTGRPVGIINQDKLFLNK